MGIFKFGAVASSGAGPVLWPNRVWNVTDFTFTTNATATLITAYNTALTSVNVPAVLNGKPTVIQNSVSFFNGVFTNKRNLTDLDFQPGVTIANNNMFAMFSNTAISDLTNVMNASWPITEMGDAFRTMTRLNVTPIIPATAISLLSTFRGCSNLINPPIIPNSVTSLSFTFDGCVNLISPPNIPATIALNTLSFTFAGCRSFVNLASYVFPNTVTNLSATFQNCYNLVHAPNLPSNLVFFNQTFSNCDRLSIYPVIPNSVRFMDFTFRNNYAMTTPPAIPNGVQSLIGAFFRCMDISTTPLIPNTVITLRDTFHTCSNVVTVQNIGTSTASLLTNMDNAFRGASKVTGNIFIHSNRIAVNSGFRNTFNGTFLAKTVGVRATGPNLSFNTFRSATISNLFNIAGKNGVTVTTF